MGGRRVRRADLGVLQRAARAAARAVPGPAASRHSAAALPAARARPGRSHLSGRRAGPWPAALTSGASPDRPPDRRPGPLSGRRPAQQHSATADRKEDRTRRHRTEPIDGGGAPRGARRRRFPGGSHGPPAYESRAAAPDDYPAAGDGRGAVVAGPLRRDGDVRAQDQVVVAEDDILLLSRLIQRRTVAGWRSSNSAIWPALTHAPAAAPSPAAWPAATGRAGDNGSVPAGAVDDQGVDPAHRRGGAGDPGP